jgi:ADP-ribosylglycohydrolase
MSSNLAQTDSPADQIRRSALWAAFGDAVGFITELADARLVRRRAGLDRITSPVPWKRRVGGRSGASLTLPAGTVSDDTQLRLAISRSIREDGAFDVEAFSKIELTVWPAYALGAGRGTTAAAASLRRRSVTWAVNHFDDRAASYFKAGGNGAAMRIQSHVWSTRPDQVAKLVGDVVSDAVSTHGHPRGIFGALFHAQTLRHAWEQRCAPGPDKLLEMASSLPAIAAAARTLPVLTELWLAQWEAGAKLDLVDAAETVKQELESAIHSCEGIDRSRPAQSYSEVAERLDARNPAQRGSGTQTSLLAALAAWLMGDDPYEMVTTCVNELGTDTDTIATMAGAIAGAFAGSAPGGELLDHDYIVLESERMAQVLYGRRTDSFPYPYMLDWAPPKSASDSIGDVEGRPMMAGLGSIDAISEEHGPEQPSDALWQWFDLWYGQRVLGKRRVRPRSLPRSQRVTQLSTYLAPGVAHVQTHPEQQTLLLDEVHRTNEVVSAVPTLHEMTDVVIGSGFDARTIGEGLLRAAQWHGVEGAIAFSSIVAKAQLSRSDRERRRAEG